MCKTRNFNGQKVTDKNCDCGTGQEVHSIDTYLGIVTYRHVFEQTNNWRKVCGLSISLKQSKNHTAGKPGKIS